MLHAEAHANRSLHRHGGADGDFRRDLFFGDRRHTRLTTLRPKIPLGRNIRTMTIMINARL
ncbi:MAG TPA: hypothetical protein VNV38_22230, partial [Stellaceae bacterium]|nr:hypothetical protein [Stellaceae bacterium]